MFIHLGDGERDIAALRLKYPDIDLRCVRGNCDYGFDAPNDLVVEAGKAKIFCTHGYRYQINHGVGTLCAAAWDCGCNVALFGHTHERYIGNAEGIDLMNPGSCSCPRDGNKPSYGIIDVTDAGIFLNIFNVGE